MAALTTGNDLTERKRLNVKPSRTVFNTRRLRVRAFRLMAPRKEWYRELYLAWPANGVSEYPIVGGMVLRQQAQGVPSALETLASPDEWSGSGLAEEFKHAIVQYLTATSGGFPVDVANVMRLS